MKVTVKGQITIPLALRERFGLNPGTEVEFIPDGGALLLKPRQRKKAGPDRFSTWLAKARGSATCKTMTTDEIMALTRGED